MEHLDHGTMMFYNLYNQCKHFHKIIKITYHPWCYEPCDRQIRLLCDTLKHGTITVSGFGYFHKNCRFLWKKNVSKTNLGSTIHYTYTSYNKLDK